MDRVQGGKSSRPHSPLSFGFPHNSGRDEWWAPAVRPFSAFLLTKHYNPIMTRDCTKW
jgi:hypothetical protein